jgi:hypothetical protein
MMEKTMKQMLAVTRVGDFTEPEPSVVEIDLVLADNSVAVLRMNVFVAAELADKLAAIGG